MLDAIGTVLFWYFVPVACIAGVMYLIGKGTDSNK